MPKTIFYCLLFILACACGGNTSTERTDGYSRQPANEEDSLLNDIMKDHDAAMAKWGKLKSYREKINKNIDSLARLSSDAKASAEAELKRLGEELKTAEDRMNNWMESFDIDSATSDLGKRLSYLRSEKIKVNDIRDSLLTALKKADSLLKNQ